MFKIYDGRKEFFQWDIDQKLIVSDPTINEVHFCNQTGDCALVCEVYEEGALRLVNVPNVLFQDIWPIKAYAHCDCATITARTFNIVARSKPADYVYTETEVKRWDELYKRLDELELGSRAIIDVDELPTDNINSALLYRTPDGVYWHDGAWHKVLDDSNLSKTEKISFDGEYDAETNKAATVETVIRKVAEIVANAPENFNTLRELSDWLVSHEGNAAEMNSAIKANTDSIAEISEGLTEYVKKNDYGYGKLSRTSATHGMAQTSDGYIHPTVLEDTTLESRGMYRWLCAYNIDGIVKTGISDNKYTLTDTEKSQAAKWLGVPTAYEFDSPEMLVDIPFSYGFSIHLNPDTTAYHVSDKTFTKDELLNNGFPFYIETEDTVDNIRQTFSLEQANIYERDGYIQISVGGASAFIVYDYTIARFGDEYPTSNGIYFADDSYYCTRLARLYRDSKGLKQIDNKYLDLANHPIIMNILSKLK